MVMQTPSVPVNATASYGEPWAVIPQANQNAIYAAAYQTHEAQAAAILNNNPADVVIRDVDLKNDLGQSNQILTVTYSSANADTVIVNHAIPVGTVLLLFSFGFNTPNSETQIINVKRGSGGSESLLQVNTRQVLLSQSPILYLANSVLYKNQATVYITGQVKATGTEEYSLGALVASQKSNSPAVGT